MDPDELAGIVDLFGGLDRTELRRACSEAAFRRGDGLDEDAFEAAIADALEGYVLVDHDGLLVVGPAAFPRLPEGAEDLPHILDVEPRSVDRAAVVEAVQSRFRTDAAQAVDRGDLERCERLLDLSYDLDTWRSVSLSETRERLDDVLDGA